MKYKVEDKGRIVSDRKSPPWSLAGRSNIRSKFVEFKE